MPAPHAFCSLPWTAGALALDVWSVNLLGPATIAQRQRTRLAQLLQAAVAGSAYHRSRLRGIDPATAPLGGLPVLHKHQLMQHFDTCLTDPSLSLAELRRFAADRSLIGAPCHGGYAVRESSGSSGEPGLFVQDAQALAVYDTLEALRRDAPRPLARLADPGYLGERMAFVGAIEGHFASQVSLQRLRRRAPWLASRWAPFTVLQPLPALVAELNRFAPTIVATYPSAAAMLAAEQRGGRLQLALSEVWTGGETLGTAVRTATEQAFGCPLRNSYGASEFLPIAWECRQRALHVNADWVILEPVDARHRPVPPGVLSHTTLLTNLANQVQPLIRYDIGDRIRWQAGRCACGSPLPVIEVQGRCDDTLLLAARTGPPVALLPLALATVLEDDAGLFDFHLEQIGASHLRLRLGAVHAGAGPRAARVLKAFAARQGAADVRVSVVPGRGRALPRGRSGKLQRVIRRVA